PGGYLRSGMPPASRRADVRYHDAAQEGHERTHERRVAEIRDGAGPGEQAVHSAIDYRRVVGAVRQLGAPDSIITVTSPGIVRVGSALPSGSEAPSTPRDLPHTGGPANPSARALGERFGDAVLRVEVGWGETTVYVEPAPANEILMWLRDDESHQYNFLSDVTCVEYRDYGRPLQVVWHLRSLPFRRFLRVKVELPVEGDLE